MPSLIVPSFAQTIFIHPIPSFHAYPENVRVSGYIIEFEKSIHPALSAHAYPESVHGSRGLPDAAGINSTFSNHTHQIVSTQKYPVRVHHIAMPHEYPASVGCCQNFINPGFPSHAHVVQESGVLIPQNIHGLCVAPPFHTR